MKEDKIEGVSSETNHGFVTSPQFKPSRGTDWLKRCEELESEIRTLQKEKENLRTERNELYRQANELRMVLNTLESSSDAQRRSFCRQAAIALYARPVDADGEDLGATEAWTCARELWRARPEDM
jgi:uncharacterized protein YlxW (UPF0749 family)